MLASDTACNFLKMAGILKLPDLKTCKNLFHSHDQEVDMETESGKANMKETLDNTHELESRNRIKTSSTSDKYLGPSDMKEHLTLSDDFGTSTSTEHSGPSRLFEYAELSVSSTNALSSSDSYVEEKKTDGIKSIENCISDSIHEEDCGENNSDTNKVLESIEADKEENGDSVANIETEKCANESISQSSVHEGDNLNNRSCKEMLRQSNECGENMPIFLTKLSKLEKPDSDSEIDSNEKLELGFKNVTSCVKNDEQSKCEDMNPCREALNAKDVVQVPSCSNINKCHGQYSRPWESSVNKQNRNICLDFLPQSCKRLSKAKEITYKFQDVMQFAEILYKCTLCNSVPSILTSRQSFIHHMQRNHLEMGKHNQACPRCSLLFQTEEDLRHHIQLRCSAGSPSSESCDQTGSDIIQSHDYDMDSSNDSDSDSSGHRQLRTKLVNRKLKPAHDFQNPHQLVDHTGMETPNGSLDLSKKTSNHENTVSERFTLSPVKKETCNIDIKKITDQIVKSDVLCHRQSTDSGSKIPHSPGYTAEFGKYTKLVREGGNIVYFCQICNWKSPIKSTFQTHCNLAIHKNKVLSAGKANNGKIEDNDRSKVDIKPDIATSGKLSTLGISEVAHNKSVTECAPKISNENLFYKYIVHSANEGHNQMRSRTPVVSMFGNHKTKMFAGSHFMNKRASNWPSEIQFKRKKRTHERAFNRPDNSDSDDDNNECDDDNADNLCVHKNGIKPSYKALLRSKLMGNGYKNCSSQENHELPSNKISNCPFSSSHCRVDNYESLKGGLKTTCTNKKGPLFNVFKCNVCSSEFRDNEDYRRHLSHAHKSILSSILLSENPNSLSPVTKMESFPTKLPGSLSNRHSGSQLFDEYGASMNKQLFSEFGLLNNHETGSPKMNESGCRLGVNEVKEASDSGATESGEQWRVQKLKELLPNYVNECKRSNVSRDRLLQCIGSTTEYTDAVLWSSACNKVVREMFPRTLAQRKGRYKKYPFFGLSLLEAYQTADDVSSHDSDWLFHGSHHEGQPLQFPPREYAVEPSRIVEQLPAIVKWTGCMEEGVYRQDLLTVLAVCLCEEEACHWGAQANRAMRHVFPLVDMKRKGKYKSTMYMGVQFQPYAQRLLSNRLDCFQRFDHFTYQTPSPIYQLTERNLGTRTPQQPPFTDLKERSDSPAYKTAYNENKAPQSRSENRLLYSFSESIRRDAENEMDEYLMKFGGLSSRESNSGSPVNKGSEHEINREDSRKEFTDSREATLDRQGCDFISKGKESMFAQESWERMKMTNRRNYFTIVATGLNETSEDGIEDFEAQSDELENKAHSALGTHLKEDVGSENSNLGCFDSQKEFLDVQDKHDLFWDSFEGSNEQNPSKHESLLQKTEKNLHLQAEECSEKDIEKREMEVNFRHKNENHSTAEDNKIETIEILKQTNNEVVDHNEVGHNKEEPDLLSKSVETDDLNEIKSIESDGEKVTTLVMLKICK
ncbi:uncharacterized protein LOC127838902 [Dreissena polymorpha]|uniref:uncharacterized protein LOC127838902 n=1 Tax=Dreissena polymorpha TaxID=45954 RepID=UPI0022654A12|nr:uncharacterized protein LOC127838902 [Dreissena polymorpha]XP_052222944.1 uncharacterized protein LOC127838902 [Dreissena polymorpha]XP_052222945.1 uncharacterized protein LOC127838902 [Dreissena polymorpha]XP_052222947.1 uncharacterized protein LOC127838902 [Dreissena polymorpha]XP_052222948.1 uncharacterized protein LOC127838902 [Dreissena polymorpha]